MPFRTVEISGDPPQRYKSDLEFETREEAAKSADQSAKTFVGGNGYKQQQDYWWGKDKNGKITRITVEAF